MWLHRLITNDAAGEFLYLTANAQVDLATLSQYRYATDEAPASPLRVVLAGADNPGPSLREWLSVLHSEATSEALDDAMPSAGVLIAPNEPRWGGLWTDSMDEDDLIRTLCLCVPHVVDAEVVQVAWVGLWLSVSRHCFVVAELPLPDGRDSHPHAEAVMDELVSLEIPHRVAAQKAAGAALKAVVPPLEAYGYFMQSIVELFDGAATELLSRHELWEADFFRGDAQAQEGRGREREKLLSIGEAGIEIRQVVNELLRLRNPVWGWLQSVEPPGGEIRAHEILSALPERLRLVRSEIRESLDLVASRDVGAQLDAQQRAQDATGRFQLIVTLVTSLVLVPGLIASFWGASVALPWKDGIEGTALLFGLMVVAGWATLALLLRVEREQMSWQQVIDYLKYDVLALQRPETGEDR